MRKDVKRYGTQEQQERNRRASFVRVLGDSRKTPNKNGNPNNAYSRFEAFGGKGNIISVEDYIKNVEAIPGGSESFARDEIDWCVVRGLIELDFDNHREAQGAPAFRLRPVDRYLTASTLVEPTEALVQAQAESEL